MRTLTSIFGLLLVAGSVFASTLDFSYDAAGRLVNVNYGGNTNTVFSYDNNGNLLNQSTFVSANPDLAIAQSATPSPVAAGVSLQYSVTVFNNSTNLASGVSVTNSLPANATYLSATTTQGTVVHNGNLLNWSVGILTNAAAATFNFTVRPTSAGNLTNVVTVTAIQVDPNSSNNTNTLVTAVIAPPIATASVSNSSVRMSWPISGGGSFLVEYTGDLLPPVIWTPDPAAPVISGDEFDILEPLTGTNRFYRLVSRP
jgi:uncharacterized repeat protein (TIGR01451 family)